MKNFLDSALSPLLLAVPSGKGDVATAAYITSDNTKFLCNAGYDPVSPVDGTPVTRISKQVEKFSRAEIARLVPIGTCSGCSQQLVASASLAEYIDRASADVHCPTCATPVTANVNVTTLLQALASQFEDVENTDGGQNITDPDVNQTTTNPASPGGNIPENVPGSGMSDDQETASDEDDEDFDDDEVLDEDEDYDNDEDDDEDGDPDSLSGDEDDDLETASKRKRAKKKLATAAEDADEVDPETEDDEDEAETAAILRAKRARKAKKLRATAAEDEDADDSTDDAAADVDTDDVDGVIDETASIRKFAIKSRKAKKLRATAADDIDDEDDNDDSDDIDDVDDSDDIDGNDDMDETAAIKAFARKSRRQAALAAAAESEDDANEDGDFEEEANIKLADTLRNRARKIVRKAATAAVAVDGNTDATMDDADVDALMEQTKPRAELTDVEVDSICQNTNTAQPDAFGTNPEVAAARKMWATAEQISPFQAKADDMATEDNSGAESTTPAGDNAQTHGEIESQNIDAAGPEANEEVAGDKIVDWSKDSIQLASGSNPDIVHVFANDTYVGRLFKTRASATVVAQWGNDTFQQAFQQECKNGFSATASKEFGWVPATFRLKTNAHLRTMMRNVQETAKATVADKVQEHAKIYQQSLQIAAIASLKGTLPGLDNPLYDAVASTLAQVGVENPGQMADSILSTATQSWLAKVIAKAEEIANKPLVARNEVAQMVAQASYRPHVDTAASELAGRLSKGNTSVQFVAPKPVVTETASQGSAFSDQLASWRKSKMR